MTAPCTAGQQKNLNGGNLEMRENVIHIILIFLLAMVSGMCSSGSSLIFAMNGPCPGDIEHQPDTCAGQSGIPNEKYHLFTDRTIYAAGEKIRFRALNLSPASMKSPVWSKVLYVELIDALHRSVARGKYFTNSRGSEGALPIPSTMQTGNYYLRAYTRWMRNFPANNYATVGMVIINPNHPPDREGPLNGGDPKVQPEADAGKYPSEPGITQQPDDGNGDQLSNHKREIRLNTDRNTYPVRSKVRLEIEIPESNEPVPVEYTVTVAPHHALEPRAYDPEKCENSTLSGTNARFLPETRGIMLSGRMMKNGRLDPSDYVIVHSSILGNGSGYAGVRTNEEGKFHIVLSEASGLLNLCIAAEEEHGEILIDNDFSTEHSGVVAAYSLSDAERELATAVMLGAQVEKAYDRKPLLPDTLSGEMRLYPESGDSPFYGRAMKTILIDDFVPLPSLEEFIVELLPEINIRKRKGETSISLQGMHTDLAFYPPLILYDFVPVFDLEGFLQLTPEDIQRIEVVNATFTRGDLTFGGIVSVLSRKGDLSGYALGGSSYFFDFEAYNDTKLPDNPDYSKGRGDLHIPDYRNTLFWEPSLSGRPGETVVMEFYTSDRPGNYIAVVRGISPRGKILTGEASFRIHTEQ